MTSHETLDAEALLRHGAWLAQLARALVARDDQIDDVVQQTYAQALATPPRHATNVRSWLGAIARNVVRSSRRRDAARAKREELAAPPQSHETPDELVARAELRRAVVDAVLALAEPYRGAVIRRFFEEQEVAAIAQATKSPEATVRTRIRRGVEQVREMLQASVARDGTDANAARALLFARLQEFATSSGGASGAAAGAAAEVATLVTGGVVMSIAAKLTLAGVAVAAAGLTIWIAHGTNTKAAKLDDSVRSSRAPPIVAAPPVQPPSVPPSVVAREAEPIAAEREASSSKGDTAAGSAKLVTSVTLRGTVVDDATGEPVAGADVWILAKLNPMSDLDDGASMACEAIDDPERARDRYSPAATASTAEDGFFECSGLSPFSNWRALAFDATGRCAVSSVVRPDDDHPTRELKLRLVRTVVLKGKVTDADLSPIVGASVVVMMRQARAGAAARVVETQATPEPGAWTTGPIAATLFDVRAEAKGFEPSAESRRIEVAPGQREIVLDFTLARSTATLCSGPIVDLSGAPIDLGGLLPRLFGEATLEDDVRCHLSVAAIRGTPPIPAVGSRASDWKVNHDEMIPGSVVADRNGYAIPLPPQFNGLLVLIADSCVAGSARIDDLTAPPPLPFDVSGIVPPAPTATLLVGLVDATTGARVDVHKSEIGVLPAIPQMRGYDVTRESTNPSGARVAEVDVRAGRMIVTFARRGFVTTTVEVTMKEAGERRVVELPLVRASASIRGHVAVADVDFDGFVLKPSASVFAYVASGAGFEAVTSAPVIVNEAGRFEITGLAPQEYVLVVESHGVAPTVVHARAAETPPELELTLARGNDVRFRVARPRLTYGLTDAMWRIVDAEGVAVVNMFRPGWHQSTQDGQWRATLTPGHYQILIWSRGCRESNTEFDVPAPGPIEIALERAR